MRIISKRRLREFWKSQKSDAPLAQRHLSAWFQITRNAEWDHFASLRQTLGSADQVGNCVVFDVGNNRFRLIGRINYGAGIVYVLRVMDHEEYDKQLWIETCGCHKPPPTKPSGSKKTPPKAKPRQRPK